MNDDRLLTLPEIADLTRLPISTLRYYRHRGEGPPTFRLGRRVVAWEHDVAAWIHAQGERGASTPPQSSSRRGGR